MISLFKFEKENLYISLKILCNYFWEMIQVRLPVAIENGVLLGAVDTVGNVTILACNYSVRSKIIFGVLVAIYLGYLLQIKEALTSSVLF